MLRPFSQKTDYQFKYIVKKISSDFNNIQLEFKSTGNVIMVNFVVDPENRHELETGEISYFHLKKDQTLLYKIPADSDATEDKVGYIYASNKNILKLNAT